VSWNGTPDGSLLLLVHSDTPTAGVDAGWETAACRRGWTTAAPSWAPLALGAGCDWLANAG